MGAAGAEAPGGGYRRARRGGRRGTGRRRGRRRGQRGGDTRSFAQWLGLRIRRSVMPFTVVTARVLVTILDREKHSRQVRGSADLDRHVWALEPGPWPFLRPRRVPGG